MLSTFIGREQQLSDVDNLINTKQGCLYALKGNAGMGKSTLLKRIAEMHRDKGRVFIDSNDLPPLQTAVKFLQYAAQRAMGLIHTREALTKINDTYKHPPK
jgi:ABC-type phosphate/phosphonate transport system ATPase subunit